MRVTNVAKKEEIHDNEDLVAPVKVEARERERECIMYREGHKGIVSLSTLRAETHHHGELSSTVCSSIARFQQLS